MLAVRCAVNVIPRDLLGVPILAIAIPLGRLPGPPYGPFVQIERRARIPLIDVGTIRLTREGHIALLPGIERFTRTGVVFTDGSVADVAAPAASS
jgi:hypothetical protein